MDLILNRGIGFVGAALALLLHATDVSGQNTYLINGGDVVTCSGVLGTTGGVNGEEYGNNEDHVITICPDIPGQAIFLTFNAFNLSEAGSSPQDQITFHDGPDATSPVIGTFSGTSIDGNVVAATPSNVSGCLTVHFTSNEVGTGTFSAFIECDDPCWPPVANAVVVGEDLPARVCVGESVSLDGALSQPYPGRTIVDLAWDMKDGTVLNGVTVTHTYSEPGEYPVELVVTDDVGCTNVLQMTVPVRVGTIPSFDGVSVSQDEICQGGEVELTGAVNSPTWSNLPQPFIEGLTELPDGSGVTYESELTVSGFPFGTVVNSPDDVVSVCIVLEHSFMGDLVVNLEGPTGQEVLLFNGNPGGGTYLGGANNNDDLTPGEGWLYCFQNTAALGTLAAEAVANNTVVAGTNPPSDAMPAGTYTSEESFNGFLGAQLNGVWTLSILDDAFIDDGFIFEWYINFSPVLYPDIVSFTPIYGAGADSTFWSGLGLGTLDAGADNGTAIATNVGPNPFVYTAINDFGCTYDTTIIVTAYPPPEVDVTAVQGVCTEQAQLNAVIVANPPPPEPCTYTLILYDTFGDGWSGGAQVTVDIEGAETAYTLPDDETTTITFTVPFGTTFDVSYTAGTLWNGENSFILLDPAGVSLYTSPIGPLTGTVWTGTSTCIAGIDAITFIWTPATGVSANGIPDPSTTISTPTFFTVVAYPNGQPWCSTDDTITVQPPSVLENDSIVTHVLCNGEDGSLEVLTSGLGGPWNYRWFNAAGAVIRQTQLASGDILSAPAGAYSVEVEEGPNGNGCSDTLFAVIEEPPLLEWDLVSADTTICFTGEARLGAAAVGGTVPIDLVWDQGLVGSGPHVVSPSDSTLYAVFAQDANGCTTDARTVLVAVRDTLTYVPLEDFDQCSGVPFTLLVDSLAGGDGDYTYLWNITGSTEDSLTDSIVVDATYCVTVRDGCETPPVTSCTDITVLNTPPLEVMADTTLGCRPFEVAFTLRDTTGGASVLWEFGDGLTAATGPLVSHIYDLSRQFDVRAMVSWPNGCVTDTTLVELVEVIPVPTAAFGYEPDPLSIFEPEARFFELAGPNEVGYAWDFFDFGTSDEPEPVITFPNDIGRHYPVQLVVWNELGCADTLLREIPVDDAFLMHIPNTFTPNGDALNEEFRILGNDLSDEEFELNIFDRWGKVVFSSTNPGLGWNGLLPGGTEAQVGVYVWRLKARSLQTLEKRILMGHVTLVR
ncbi:MAG: PKD domain-containing protein [Flavobacteriales bacterium]